MNSDPAPSSAPARRRVVITGLGTINPLGHDAAATWDAVHAEAKELDTLINEFNEATGLLKTL